MGNGGHAGSTASFEPGAKSSIAALDRKIAEVWKFVDDL
jgi:hypothetical protein